MAMWFVDLAVFCVSAHAVGIVVAVCWNPRSRQLKVYMALVIISESISRFCWWSMLLCVEIEMVHN